jgi:hypothetical protein
MRESFSPMATAKTKQSTAKKPQKPLTRRQKFAQLRKSFMARRPHRSFRRTYRRDYVRSLALPGYFAFTSGVVAHIWRYKKVFISAVIVYSLLGIVLVGTASQETYSQSVDLLKETSSNVFSGAWGELGKGSILLFTIASGSFDSAKTEVQQLYAALLFIVIWMCTVWLVRAQLAGNTPRFRDALYNSSSPLISTLFVGLLFVIQLLPAAIGILLYRTSVDFLSGALSMIVFLVMILLVVLTLYLTTSTFVALVVVTLPGMYPWQALRAAGDLVVGRRIRILLRLLWGLGATGVVWALVMTPIIIVSMWLQGISSQLATIPTVPVLLVFVSSAATIFLATYVYLLYRKVVDDDAKPA